MFVFNFRAVKETEVVLVIAIDHVPGESLRADSQVVEGLLDGEEVATVLDALCGIFWGKGNQGLVVLIGEELAVWRLC